MSSLPELKDYDVVGRLAVGGMAEIYRAKARGGVVPGQDVVLKRLLPLHREDKAYVELFIAEARLGVVVAHPNIVRTHDLFRAGRDYFIVQELVGGDTLGSLVARAKKAGRRLDPNAAMVIFTDLLEALRHLHAGAGVPGHPPIIHRDVNPQNVVASPEGVAKLIDFGVAEALGAAVRERTGALRGTPAYMSPEQVKSRPLDARSDLFSAGIVLWELIAGQPLFGQQNEFETLRQIAEVGAPPLRSVDRMLPVSFERVCVHALAADRDRRFPTADAFITAVNEAMQREGLSPDRRVLGDEVNRLSPNAPRVGVPDGPRKR